MHSINVNRVDLANTAFFANETLTTCYNNIWRELDTWCVENLEGDDADYYFEVTD